MKMIPMLSVAACLSLTMPALAYEFDEPDDNPHVEAIEGAWVIDAALIERIMSPEMVERVADEKIELLFIDDPAIADTVDAETMDQLTEDGGEIYASGRAWAFEDDGEPDAIEYLISGFQGQTWLVILNDNHDNVVELMSLFTIQGMAGQSDVLFLSEGVDEAIPLARVTPDRLTSLQDRVQEEGD